MRRLCTFQCCRWELEGTKMESDMFMVKALRHTNKYSFYICEKCFKSFKKDILTANIKKCSEKDLSTMLKEANENKKELDKQFLF